MGAVGARGAMGAVGARGAVGAMSAMSAMGAIGAMGAMGARCAVRSDHVHHGGSGLSLMEFLSREVATVVRLQNRSASATSS